MPPIDITHILCPVDLSEASRDALAHAVALARWYRARVTVLHVFELFVPPQLLPADPGPMVNPYPLKADLVADVERFVAPVTDAAITLDVVVEEGPVYRKIVSLADTRNADLIVMGTHGRGGFDRLVLGSVAEKVLRKAECPVLIVPAGAAGTPSTVRFGRILCPVDFSPSSAAALRFAVSIAKEANGRITMLHVVEWSPDDNDSLMSDADFLADWKQRAERNLVALITDDDRLWCDPRPRIVCGKAYRKILDVARDEQTDLIVMGVAGRAALDLMFFGSTTNQVVRHAACPVLTLRGATAAE